MPLCVSQGSYFADDAGKIDQYVWEDKVHTASNPLHQVLRRARLRLCFPKMRQSGTSVLSAVRRWSDNFSMRCVVQRLYNDSRHPGNVFYAFVFRYVPLRLQPQGFPAHAVEGLSTSFALSQIMSMSKREGFE